MSMVLYLRKATEAEVGQLRSPVAPLLTQAQASLLHLPAEIEKSQGAFIAIDQVNDSQVRVGNKEILDRFPPIIPSSRHDNRTETQGMATPLLLAVLLIAVIIVALLLKTSRSRQEGSN